MKAELYLDLPASPDLPIRIARVRGGQLEDVDPSALNVSSRIKSVAFAPALAFRHGHARQFARGHGYVEQLARRAVGHVEREAVGVHHRELEVAVQPHRAQA